MKFKHIHFVGIKGVGMTPLALIAKQAGITVGGSDVADRYITDESLNHAEIIPFVGFSKDHIIGADLVITTGAHGGFINEEVVAAKENNIPVWSQGQAVGEYMRGELFDKKFIGISVAGTHGKTTTTGMLATIFMSAKKDPSFCIGTSHIPSLPASGHFGKGDFFIAEADEYATAPQFDATPKLLWQHPRIGIVTIIDFDHPDVYTSLSQVQEAFLQFTKNVQEDGIVILNGDDINSLILIKETQRKILTFGMQKENNYVISEISTQNGKTTFFLSHNEKKEQFSLGVFGQQNVYNAASAIVASYSAGLSYQEVTEGIALYTGSKRRSEYIGTLQSGALLFDDYAHHPTEIQVTLQAFRQAFPDKKIVCVFQPHTFSRTKQLFNSFTTAFSNAHTVIITDIYASARELLDSSVSSQKLVDAMKTHPHVLFLQALSDVASYIQDQKYGQDTVVITMGAGDIYTIKNMLEVVV